jgi:putative cell wall-binding protein
VRRVRRGVRSGAVALLAALLVPAPPVVAAPAPAVSSSVSDALAIRTGAEGATAAATAVQLSEETASSAATVLIARDDAFADALASGTLQDQGPLLLVPTSGPLPPEVRAEIGRIAASQAIVLGGSAAVSDAVVAELQDLGLAVSRRAGGSRIETAAAIAADRPEATTALLARAFPAEGASASQAFADALSAGGLAAAEGWPVLLTTTDALSAATRSHLIGSAVEEVLIVGGTAAIGAHVEAELRELGLRVDRVAGADRFETAVAIARQRGASSADDVGRTVLLDGTADDAWVAGFAAAGHSASSGAPIVLAAGGTLPPATQAWLTGGAAAPFAQDDAGIVLTCAVTRDACEAARLALGRPPRAAVTYDPAGGVLPPGAAVTILASGAGGPLVVSGSCLDGARGLDASGGTVHRGAGEGPCALEVELPLAGGLVQREVVRYDAVPSGPLVLAGGPCEGFREVALSADGTTASYVADPARGCGAVASAPAVAFTSVADGSTTVIAVPAGYEPSSAFSSLLTLSPDGRLAVTDLQVPGQFGSQAPWVFDRTTGQVRPLAGRVHDPGAGEEVVAGGRQAWTPDGDLLGRYCLSTGCGLRIDPMTGSVADGRNPCLAYWAHDPEGTICYLTTATFAGGSFLFGGLQFDGSGVEVGFDLSDGAVTVRANGCTEAHGGGGWSVDGSGTTVVRACALPYEGGFRMGLAVTDMTTGQSRVLAIQTTADAAPSLEAGTVDPTGRWVPLRYVRGDGTSRGELHDLHAGAHVDLGVVLGVPQLHAPGAFVVVATDAGLERRPVPLA